MSTQRIALLSWLALAGCTSHLDVTAIAPLENAVLIVDRQGLARVFRIEDGSTSVTDVMLGDGEDEGQAQLFARPGSPDEALVLTEGRLGDPQHAPISSRIIHLDRTGELRRWTLHGQYLEVRTSRDGRYAIALSPTGRLVVENRVEVVDLTMDAGDANPIPLSLRSLGGESPAAAELSGDIAWSDGATLRVAALFAAGQLSLYDLDAPSDPPLTIPTTTDASMVGPVPTEGFFVGSEIVVRASAGRQILVVSLVPGNAPRRFDVAVRTLAASASIRALAIDQRGTGPRVLALSASGLDVFDLDTGMSMLVPFAASYDAILPFDGTAPGDSTSRSRIALYGSSARSVAFVELGDAPTDVLGSFVLPLSFQPDAFVADATAGRLVVFQNLSRSVLALDVAESAGRRPVSVVDLFDRSALALAASDQLSRAVVSTGLRDMWVAGSDGYVNHFDLQTELQDELWLDHSAQTLLPLLGDAQRVIAFSDLATGAFTILEPSVSPRNVTNAW